MRILVTGGTGFIGRRLVKKLSKEHTVAVLSNEDAKVPGAEKAFVGDITDEKLLRKLKQENFNAVYHLAAVLDESSPLLWKVNVEGTKALLEAFKNSKLTRFVLVSPIGVLGDVDRPAREDDPYDPRTPYEKSKAEAERVVMDFRLKHQVPYTIVRSTIVYGPNDFWKQIFLAAKEEYPIIGTGQNNWHLVYIDDAVDALVLALQPQAKNQIYNIAGPDAHTYKETYHTIKRALGLRFKDTYVPTAVAHAGALAHEIKSRIRGERPKVTKMRASITRLTGNRIVDISKAERELGYKPKYPLERGMELTAKELGLVK